MCEAEIFQQLGIVRRLPPRELSAERLNEMVHSSLFGGPELTAPLDDVRVPLNGLDKIVERITVLGGLKSRALRQAV